MRSGQGFKKLSVLALIMAILFSAVAPALAGSADSLKKAAELEKNASYFKAVKMYERAAREAGRWSAGRRFRPCFPGVSAPVR